MVWKCTHHCVLTCPAHDVEACTGQGVVRSTGPSIEGCEEDEGGLAGQCVEGCSECERQCIE